MNVHYLAQSPAARVWRIAGVSPNGKRLRFQVIALDHAEASRKAEVARQAGARIDDIVLEAA